MLSPVELERKRKTRTEGVLNLRAIQTHVFDGQFHATEFGLVVPAPRTSIGLENLNSKVDQGCSHFADNFATCNFF